MTQQAHVDHNPPAHGDAASRPPRRKGAGMKRLAWMLKRMDYLRAFQRFGQAKEILMRADIALAQLDRNTPLFVQRLREFNAVMLVLSKARYYGDVAIRSSAKTDWRRSLAAFKQATQLGKRLLALLESGSPEPLPAPAIALDNCGTEITYADGAPVVPEVCPVVILQGSSFEMGYQYAQQLIQIFGPWMLQQKAGKPFTDETLAILRKWEEQVAQYAPEILEMCRGWVKGAADAGVVMSYDDVVDIWTGHSAPKVSYMGRSDELTDTPPGFACSGAAAWGRATPDGRLVTGSSGDHDPSFPVVIMAYPDSGNNFMFTSFSAVGDIALVGSVHMFGHPGMNSKGLAYVEHGGQPRMIEPMKYWGYGLRRAASVLHILRFADSAKEALAMEMAAPIGDVGMDNFTIGGFYADSSYGYVLESRKEPVALREAGHMGETDFLYANNSAMHRDARQAGWMQRDQAINRDWEWHEHAGWRPSHFQGLKLSDLLMGGEGQARIALRGMYYGSAKRNLFHFDVLNRALGHIDMDYLRMMFRMRGAQPNVSWKQQVRAYNKQGAWGEIRVGHAGNGVITITRPDNGPHGIYSVCVGQAARGMPGNSPFFASYCPMYNETNSFWELELAETPRAAAEFAAHRAQAFLAQAKAQLGQSRLCADTTGYLGELLQEAEQACLHGERALDSVQAPGAAGDGALYGIAKAARCFLKAQAKALQVSQMLLPPPSRPDDLPAQA